MCGITGIYAYGSNGKSIGYRIQAMARTMEHRGPDDQGIYLTTDHRLAFGFRRLAIIDLSPAGRQPMCNEDGTVWIVFNGEIYNHAERRVAMEAKGHRYRGRSDTETIIHLYEQYGEDCVEHLRGMFAFAIWDQRKSRLFLARDRMGIKPLYYAASQGTFLFGSEIKAILASEQIARSLDTEAMSHYLTFMIPPAPLTMFENIRKLPAGYCMTVDADGTVKQRRYWDAIGASGAAQRSDQEYAGEVRNLLDESVRMRMMSDVPYGVLLSGGLDSSLIAALMARHSEQPLNTFSVGFEGYENYNEMKFARQVSRRLAAHHHEVLISHKDALDYIPNLVHSQDEPIADWVCIPLYFLSKMVRDNGVVVAQLGEGADELFCGYPLYLASLTVQKFWPLLSKIPESVLQFGTAIGARLHHAELSFGHKVERMMQLLRLPDGRFWGGALAIYGRDKNRLLNTPFWSGRTFDSGEVLDSVYAEIFRARPQADALQRMIYFEFKQRLAELLLMRVDKITMSASIEARVPYLDHRLVEFSLAIPTDAKIRGHCAKAVLKRSASELVPENIINRRKQGFSAPIAEWFRSELAGEVRSTLLGGELVRRGYLNRAFVAELLDQHQEFRANRSVELWNLYNLEAWHRHWIN